MATARLPFVWDYDLDEGDFAALLQGRKTLGRLDRDWAAVRLPGLLSAWRADWQLIRWIEAPDPDTFLADLRRLGEELALLPPPRQ